MKKTLMTLFLFALKSLKGARPYQRSFMDLARLKASLMYVKSIETARLLFVSMLGIGICLGLILVSLALFHAALFLYAPWSAEVKLWVGLGFAAIYMGIAVKALSYVFSESKWLEIFHADEVIEDIAGKSAVPPSSTAHAGEYSRTKSTYRESGSHN